MTLNDPVILSLLDTDLYKLTMHAAVHMHFPSIQVSYKYNNRTENFRFNKEAILWLEKQFGAMGHLRFSLDEIEYLKNEVPYLPDSYWQYISNNNFKLDPKNEVKFQFKCIDEDADQYELDITIEGLWQDTILYEIPMLALISEAYFKFVDTDWNYDLQIENAYSKAVTLLENDLSFIEFGTRRRRSKKTHDLVLQGILKAVDERKDKKDLFLGTSNILMAKNYGLRPMGTVAHEWIMGIASVTNDYRHANENAMNYWIKTFGWDHVGFALTDTFGTDNFLKSFLPPYSDVYLGVRQDSGDPIEFTEKISNHYLNVLNCPLYSKTICYSDSLDVEKALRYSKAAKLNGMASCFGIGTNFTNDFTVKSAPDVKSQPLNIVIKLFKANGNPAVKLSDNHGKNMGDPDKLREVKALLGYRESSWEEVDESNRW
ncbi:nicotinate phosphoribosyltransferase Ecym_8310 [Eremothecium cymbalariae DBVPG|uniref:Nicotinate phosphoribosyltransferase n=1 Tax=Eremothecium cymbalariae (strain CBS 270.75 / DBVPG 7215 / KCTC 17166 / NRRL Y-17582) TaxID=931890 RepID=G8JXL4_ERECY|nr:Hypothetical protein Ecym_8310 [Eremothecium cymbalariae DBVPG\